jgi:hypothetical protein
MSALFEAAHDLQEFLESRRWRFCFIGGLAVLRWGEPRFTRDVDGTVICPFGSEDEVVKPLLDSGYVGRISDAGEFARQNRVLLLEARNRVPIDLALGALPFEETMIERSSLFEFEANCTLRTCSAEDLVVLKLFAFRPRDVLDAGTVVIRQHRDLDWQYIEMNLQPLAEVKGQPEIMTTLEKIRRQADQSG